MVFDLLAGDFAGPLPNIFGEVASLIEGLLPDIARLVLYLVRELAEAVVLDPRARNQHARQEPDRNRANGEPDRILLSDADGLASLSLDLFAVREGITDK